MEMVEISEMETEGIPNSATPKSLPKDLSKTTNLSASSRAGVVSEIGSLEGPGAPQNQKTQQDLQLSPF